MRLLVVAATEDVDNYRGDSDDDGAVIDVFQRCMNTSITCKVSSGISTLMTSGG